MKAGLLQWVVCLGLLGAPPPGGAQVGVPHQVGSASASLPSSAEEAWKLRPIKKRVGRAVTPTMDKIDNIGFVISQILIPLSAIIFSVIYVRRYRARHAAATADPPTGTGEQAIMEGETTPKITRPDDNAEIVER